MVEQLQTDVLIVGGGAGGTAAAIQAARRGVEVILVSEFDWLGGMLTSAGVTAPDGNELAALQTGIWGEFLRELRERQIGGLDNAWVSLFTYEAQIGAQIFADWVAALPNLTWIRGQVPQSVQRFETKITGVTFADYQIQARITIDGTELGDLAALANIPYRWGWELQGEFQEPSAPVDWNNLTASYPVQVPTWVVVMQDYGEGQSAPPIPAPPNYQSERYKQAWVNHGAEHCLNYGRLPNDRFMINWPIHGNDYGENVDRLLGDAEAQRHFYQEALWHSLGFAHYIQAEMGDRYGLAIGNFPWTQTQCIQYELPHELLSAFAMHPYHRESRRIIGLTTVREQDILPLSQQAQVAALPIYTSASGCDNVDSACESIAIGNYVLDHHYPSGDIKLSKKSMQWGGRWTGTPFSIPYRSLIPKEVDGFLACEKNISVTHLANGATRLQPLVLGIGQAAGMAAAICVERLCHPRSLHPRLIQEALLTDTTAPAAVIPLLNQTVNDPTWHQWQQYYLDHPESYPQTGNAPNLKGMDSQTSGILLQRDVTPITGRFTRVDHQQYELYYQDQTWQLVTLRDHVNQQLCMYLNEQEITVFGAVNKAGNWILVEHLKDISSVVE